MVVHYCIIYRDVADANKVPVFIANDPLDCVAIGTGESLKSIDVAKKKQHSGVRHCSG